MKLSLNFNSTVNAGLLQKVVEAAGENTSINIGNAQKVNIATLLDAIDAAGDSVSLGADFVGSELTANNLQQAMAAAGDTVAISINTAQAVNINTLLDVIDEAGNAKKLSATFNGAQLTSNNLERAVKAAGNNVRIGVNTAQAVNITTLLSVLKDVGDSKQFFAIFNGAQLTSNNLQRALSEAGENTSISVNTAQAVNIGTLLSVIQEAGNEKQFSAEFNGAQLSSNNLQQAVAAAGAKVRISVNTAQAVNINTLISVLQTAGNTKFFSADFNGAQSTADNLIQAVNNAGSKTTISVNTAQATNIAQLLDAIDAAGDSKMFSATFNGAQLTSNNLQQAVSAAGANTTISVVSAESAPQSVLLQIIKTAG